MRVRGYCVGLRPLVGIVIGLLAVSGCGGGPEVLTPTDMARSSLEAGLKAWTSGGKPGAIDGQKVALHFVDSVWQAGRKLKAYSIGDADTQGSDRRFPVRLTLAAPDETEEVRYVVIGSGPIWVYRESDYQRMLNMDNNPVAPKQGRGGR